MSDHEQAQAGPVAPLAADADFPAAASLRPSAWDDVRRHPRFHYRVRLAATIHPLAGKGGAGQSVQRCTLLTRDLSRGGMNLLHSAQLFPGQQIDVVLQDGATRSVEVMWCRRLAHRCYSVGCRFIKPSADAPPAPS